MPSGFWEYQKALSSSVNKEGDEVGKLSLPFRQISLILLLGFKGLARRVSLTIPPLAAWLFIYLWKRLTSA